MVLIVNSDALNTVHMKVDRRMSMSTNATEVSMPLTDSTAAAGSTSTMQASTVLVQQLAYSVNTLPDVENKAVIPAARIAGKTKDSQGSLIEFPIDLQWEFNYRS